MPLQGRGRLRLQGRRRSLHLQGRRRRSHHPGLGRRLCRQLCRRRARALWRPRPGALLRCGVVVVERATRGVLQRLPAGCGRRVGRRCSQARIGRGSWRRGVGGKRRSRCERLHLHGRRLRVRLVLGVVVASQHRSRDVLVAFLRPIDALLRGTSTLLRRTTTPVGGGLRWWCRGTTWNLRNTKAVHSAERGRDRLFQRGGWSTDPCF